MLAIAIYQVLQVIDWELNLVPGGHRKVDLFTLPLDTLSQRWYSWQSADLSLTKNTPPSVELLLVWGQVKSFKLMGWKSKSMSTTEPTMT